MNLTNYIAYKYKTDTGFINDEDAAIDQYPFPSDNLITNLLDGDELDDDEETISRFYNNILASASKNANRPSYNQTNDKTIFDELIRRQFRTDDYPLWKIRCKVCCIFFKIKIKKLNICLNTFLRLVSKK